MNTYFKRFVWDRNSYVSQFVRTMPKPRHSATSEWSRQPHWFAAEAWKVQLVTAALLVVLPVWGSVSGQETFPRQLRAAEINPEAPDVVEFNKRSAAVSPTVRAMVDDHGVPNDQFFALINPARSLPATRSVAPQSAELVERSANCPVEMVASDPTPLRGWFEVKYGAPCDLTLYCNWIRDPMADATYETRQLERELDLGAPARSIEVDKAAPDAAAAEVQDPNDPHLNDYGEISWSFVLAGTRKCSLTRYCEERDDPFCNVEFLALKASQIEIQQLGK